MRHQVRQQITRAMAAVLGVFVGSVTGLRAWSQEEKARLWRDGLVTPTTAYMALPPEFICPSAQMNSAFRRTAKMH